MTFQFDITSVSSTIETLPTDKYACVIMSEPKTFTQAGTEKTDGSGEAWPDKIGIRYTLRVEAGEHKGKPLILSFDLANEYAAQQAKQFLLAAYGYPTKDSAAEKRFNEEIGKQKDGNFDPNTGEVGSLWKDVKGQRIIADVDVTEGKNGKVYQKYLGFTGVDNVQ